MSLILRRIVETLPRFAYRYTDEISLHEAMAGVLADAGIEFAREVVAGPRDRFDFLVPDGIVIEAKIKGSFSQALAQCQRYAERSDVSALVLVATRFWATGSQLLESHGKPIHVVKIRGAAF